MLQKNLQNERKTNAVKMRSLRRICRVSLADGIHNEEIHRMAGTSEDVTVKKNPLLFLLLNTFILVSGAGA